MDTHAQHSDDNVKKRSSRRQRTTAKAINARRIPQQQLPRGSRGRRINTMASRQQQRQQKRRLNNYQRQVRVSRQRRRDVPSKNKKTRAVVKSSASDDENAPGCSANLMKLSTTEQESSEQSSARESGTDFAKVNLRRNLISLNFKFNFCRLLGE